MNGLPPYQTAPGGVNPDPLQVLQLAYQNVCIQLATLLATPRLNYSVDGVAANWDAHLAQLLAAKAEFEKTPGVAPTVMGPFAINQYTSRRGFGRRGGC